MDAILHTASTVATYASLVGQGLAMVFVMGLAFTAMAAISNPEVTMVVSLLAALVITWHMIRPLRRAVRVYFTWPIGRVFYRLVKKPIRLTLGGIMARWKTGVVADKLNDALEELCYTEHVISPSEYRRLSNLLGKALGLQDLIARKLHSRVAIKRTVLENIGLMKLTPPVPGPPLKVKVDPTYAPNKETVVSFNLAYLRRRNTAA